MVRVVEEEEKKEEAEAAKAFSSRSSSARRSRLETWTLFSTSPWSPAVLGVASTVDTCTRGSLVASGKFPVFLREGWPRLRGRFSGFWFCGSSGDDFRKIILDSACLLDSSYTRSRQSTGLLPDFTHFQRVGALGYHCSSCPSFLAVTCLVSASREEHGKLAFSGAWLRGNVSVFSALLDLTVDTRSCVSLRRELKNLTFCCVKVDSNPC